MNKILFISHDASRTGAPIVLFNFLTWLKENNKEIHVDVLFLKGGVLLEDFKKVSDTVFELTTFSKPETFKDFVKKRIFQKVGITSKRPKKLLVNKIVTQGYDLIYGNTVLCIPYALEIKQKLSGVKLIIHIHELQVVLQQLLPEFKKFEPFIDSFIAVSQLVKDNLVERWNVDRSKVQLIHAFSKIREVKLNKTVRSKFTIGGSGQVNWRKGYDLFIQTAFYLKKKYPNFQFEFIWVGKNWMKETVQGDLEKAGLSDIVYFVGEQDNPTLFYEKFDVFLMCSREDPFPLVCIEQALLKHPIICFENATGTGEILKKGGGMLVPYLDIQEMGESIKYYYENPAQMNKDGEIAYKLFAEFTPEKKCPEIYNLIKSVT